MSGQSLNRRLAGSRPGPPGESRMKEFRPLRLGRIRLEAGRGLLTLRALEVPGRSVMDLRQVNLTLVRAWCLPGGVGRRRLVLAVLLAQIAQPSDDLVHDGDDPVLPGGRLGVVGQS